MFELSRHEFQRHPVFNLRMGLTTERAWFQHGDRLGIVLFDNVDHDWSFVVLANNTGQFCAIDVGTSFATQAAATAALESAFAEPEHR